MRATTLIEGNLSSSVIGTSIAKSNENEDELVNIEDDDNKTYGQNQFTERDIISLNNEDERLRDLVTSNLPSTSTTATITTERETREENNQNVANSVSNSPTSYFDTKMDIDSDNDKALLESADSTNVPTNQQIIIESLKSKIREYENVIRNLKSKCLICLSQEFSSPCVSIACWHVYCERCWLFTLGAKKLCPQCSTITAASDLRRIYL